MKLHKVNFKNRNAFNREVETEYSEVNAETFHFSRVLLKIYVSENPFFPPFLDVSLDHDKHRQLLHSITSAKKQFLFSDDCNTLQTYNYTSVILNRTQATLEGCSWYVELFDALTGKNIKRVPT